ncbi:hypothetical protein SNOG_04519 [Parastagonospora nodorum SN15]|uniref:Uncharacterized protein n=1 Tax=Phaeosphaeria nodorum (strain SN15 / ATCC MYA-4574 / FGSC 10173) TaxID=321614 RepID=Q0UUP5_PHANO|nr:hypothetical protein SNOG_04519 [Parastagonospora nodorum SN15]EAT88279.2 hypothetical protein SNOG_04519 [Parastagonospora nodorum SN15]
MATCTSTRQTRALSLPRVTSRSSRHVPSVPTPKSHITFAQPAALAAWPAASASPTSSQA